MVLSDFFWTPLFLVAALALTNRIAVRSRLRQDVVVALVAWHSVFCVVYYLYSLNNPADSNAYFIAGESGYIDWSIGTPFVRSVCTVLASYLGMSKLSAFFFFNVLGCVGLVTLLASLHSVWPKATSLRNLPYFLVFLPGLSFWTSAIGKDAPAFLAACLASYALLDVQRRKIILIVAIAVMFAVRPHVAAVMFVAVVLALVLSRRGVSLGQRAILVVAGVFASVIIVPLSLTYVGLEGDVSLEAITDNIERRQGYNLGGGSSVDISSMPLPLQMFTYLFRPLFFDAGNIFSLVSSAENAILLIFCVVYVPRALLFAWRSSSLPVRYNALFSICVLAILASSTANLGIAVRQKTMLLPALLLWLAMTAGWIESRRLQRSQRSLGGVRHV